jgi:nucleotide-binding universal stress UspA family protein
MMIKIIYCVHKFTSLKAKAAILCIFIKSFIMAGILVPFDFSSNAISALDQAIMIALKNKHTIEVMHITNKSVCNDYPKSWNCDETSITALQQKLETIIDERVEKWSHKTAIKITAFVKEAAMINGGIISRVLQSKSKLVVMGTHGSSGLYDKVFGSNTSILVNHAIFPVLTIPPHWQPNDVQHCVAAIKLEKVAATSAIIKKWARFFKSDVEAVQFTVVPEAAGVFAEKELINEIPVRLIKNDIETGLSNDILTFSSNLKNTILILFTREKTFLEKLLKPNLSYKISGAAVIPILSLPFETYMD